MPSILILLPAQPGSKNCSTKKLFYHAEAEVIKQENGEKMVDGRNVDW